MWPRCWGIRRWSIRCRRPRLLPAGTGAGRQWLEEQRVDACLVIGAEETNWLLADALWHFEHAAVVSGGAGAVCLSHEPAMSLGVELEPSPMPTLTPTRHEPRQSRPAHARATAARLRRQNCSATASATARERMLPNWPPGAIGPARVSAPNAFWAKG